MRVFRRPGCGRRERQHRTAGYTRRPGWHWAVGSGRLDWSARFAGSDRTTGMDRTNRWSNVSSLLHQWLSCAGSKHVNKSSSLFYLCHVRFLTLLYCQRFICRKEYTPFSISRCIAIGAVRRTAPIRNSFVQFSELCLSTVVNFSLANWTNEFVIGSVRRTQPSDIIFCYGIPIQESGGGPISTAHSECSRPKCNGISCYALR